MKSSNLCEYSSSHPEDAGERSTLFSFLHTPSLWGSIALKVKAWINKIWCKKLKHLNPCIWSLDSQCQSTIFQTFSTVQYSLTSFTFHNSYPHEDVGSQLSLFCFLSCCPIFIKIMNNLQSWFGCLPDCRKVALPLPGDSDRLFTFSGPSPVKQDGGHRCHHASWLPDPLLQTHLTWTIMASLIPAPFATLNLYKATKNSHNPFSL